MDPFTQRILDRAEQRSKHLGISNTSKFPLAESNQTLSTNTSSNARKSPGRPKSTAKSPLKRSNDNNSNVVTFSSNNSGKSGEDSDKFDNISVEINITTDSNVGVKCDVVTMDVDEDGNVLKSRELINDGSSIRDVSRNRLQRLGALYSEPQNLSSPIHRTENKFHEKVDSESRLNAAQRPKTKFGKLAELADSINNWEDDSTSQSDGKLTVIQKENVVPSSPKSTGAIPKKYPAPKVPGSPRTTVITGSSKTVTAAPSKSPRASTSKPEIKESLTIAKGVIKKLSDQTAKDPKSPTKQLKWDKSVMDALEYQGFQRRQSNTSKLTYDYSENENRERENKINEESTQKPSSFKKKAPEVPDLSPKKKTIEQNKDFGMKDSPKKLNMTKGLVSGRAALFESSESQRPLTGRNNKDPAEMSLKDRMALFEKNKGEALIPKAPFATSLSAKQLSTGGAVGGIQLSSSSSTISTVSSTAQQSNNLSRSEKPVNLTPSKQKNIPVYNRPVVAESKANGLGIKNTVAALMSGASTISESKIAEETKRQRQMEMNLLMNRFQGNSRDEEKEKSPPPPPPMPGPSAIKRRSDGKDVDEIRRDSEESKRLRKISEGRLYPVLSDLDTSSSEQNYTTATVSEEENKGMVDPHHEDMFMDSDDEQDLENMDGSISRAVMNSIRYQNQSQRNRSGQFDSSTSDVSDALEEMDEFLDEALDDSTDSPQKTGRKGSMSSNSFSYSRSSNGKSKKSPIREKDEFITPVKSKMTLAPSKNDDNMMTLVHTVSFYRKQQQQGSSSQNNTPRQVIIRNKDNFSSTEDEESEEMDDGVRLNKDAHKVQEKVKKLLDEVCKQQQIISQTSQALNLCASTVEFSGSTESVEGERHLLVATHRRQSSLNEVQRLRVEGSVRSEGGPQERGRLSVKEITLPLKQDYIRKLAADTISGHHLVCLLKYGETVLATRTVPTLPGLLAVKFPDALALDEVYADFKITLEIYGMTAQREVLPHEIKYHIANSKKQKLLTPKGKKGGSDSKLLFMPPVQSPGGPGAVRTPGLVQYGFVIFSMREIQRTSWSLNSVSAVSPLDGSVHMKVNCELSVTVDYRGFLTMFEDVSGLGAWHRRWCRLRGHMLSYWKYPDDEKKKPPIDSIDLYTCCSAKVNVAPRDVCARLNTLLLELKRPSEEGERESLVIVKQGKNTIVRHLLSTDTKEEREVWANQFNKALTLLRAWGPSKE